MDIDRNGNFSLTIGSEQLSKGLRPSKRMPRNSGYLVKAQGVVGRDGVLSSIDDITRLATTVITDGFPFPQIFVFTNMVIVCGLYKIYELVSGSLSLKYTATTPGSLWTAVDFYDYIYLSNGEEAVIRGAGSLAYTKSATQPTCTAMCNYNGQVIIGSPDTDGLGANEMFDGNLSATTSLEGSWT